MQLFSSDATNFCPQKVEKVTLKSCSYWPGCPNQPRIDFSYYNLNMSQDSSVSLSLVSILTFKQSSDFRKQLSLSCVGTVNTSKVRNILLIRSNNRFRNYEFKILRAVISVNFIFVSRTDRTYGGIIFLILWRTWLEKKSYY